MDKETALSMLESFDGIYGTMYAQTWLNYSTFKERDEIVFIDKRSLKIWDDGFCYIWGAPGPDYNVYCWDDYGITWGFTPHEIKDPDVPEGYVLCSKCIYAPMTYGKQMSLPAKCPRSREILERRQTIDNCFYGCCDKGVAKKNKVIEWPTYTPTKEDLYDVLIVPTTKDVRAPLGDRIMTWREQEEESDGGC